MQVILLENVQNLGVLGDSVRVRPGYARNFLIPRGKAVIDMKEYKIHVFRQNIKDDKGKILGRVAVMLFAPLN